MSHLFILDPIVPFVDESYFNIRYIQTNETLIPGNETYERFRYGHSLCGDDFPFTSSEFLNRTDYISYLQCPETQSYEVSGTRTSQTYKYVLIKLSKWNNSTYAGTCKSPLLINNFLKRGQLYLSIENRYFDFDDYDDPVKAYVTDRESYKPPTSFHKRVTLFLRKNEYSLHDDLVQYRDHQEGSFYSIGSKEVDIEELTDDTVMTIQIVQDSVVDQYQRSVFTFMEMIGQLGGLYEVLTLLASFLISGIVQKFFTMSILRNLFYVECNPQDENSNFWDKNQINSIRNKISTNQRDIVEEKKVDITEENNSSIYESSQAKNKHNNYNWYRCETQSKN